MKFSVAIKLLIYMRRYYLSTAPFFVTQVKPRDYRNADDDKRDTEFVPDFKQIFPVVAEQNSRVQNQRSPRQRTRERVKQKLLEVDACETRRQ